jgi:hypothetical protein
MSSHYKWYPSTDDVTVPWNAQYEYPSYGNKAIKITPRISPKGGSTFTPGNTIRLEFPAQGYVNPANTTVAFDVTLTAPTDITVTGGENYGVWFQNNIQSCFKQIRLLYGSAPLETLNEAGYLVRQLTEFTTSSRLVLDQSSVNEGIAHTVMSYMNANTDMNPDASLGADGRTVHYLSNARARTHGVVRSNNGFIPSIIAPQHTVAGGVSTAIRRYQISLPLGLFTQGKLIPTKWMASQLAIEVTLASVAECMMHCSNEATTVVGAPSYSIGNVVMIPEILEFDASYDKMFLDGLNGGGVPIQLSTFNTNTSPVNGSIIQMVIPEKSRSLKNIFTFVRQSVATVFNDYGASYSDISPAVLEYYQVRVGGRYYPASPVLNTTVPGVRVGGAEPLLELQKALSIVGDKRLTTAVNSLTWGKPAIATSKGPGFPTIYGADDGVFRDSSYPDSAGFPGAINKTVHPAVIFPAGSSCFCMAVCLETSNGREISGLNAEEQSDIVFNCKWSATPASGYELIVYTHIDKIMLLKENNVVNLIE